MNPNTSHANDSTFIAERDPEELMTLSKFEWQWFYSGLHVDGDGKRAAFAMVGKGYPACVVMRMEIQRERAS